MSGDNQRAERSGEDAYAAANSRTATAFEFAATVMLPLELNEAMQTCVRAASALSASRVEPHDNSHGGDGEDLNAISCDGMPPFSLQVTLQG